MKLVLTHLIIFSSVANGFTAINSDPYVQKAGLRQLVDSPAKQKLSLNLDIGNEESGGSRLAVMGLVLDLRNDEVSGCEDIITMPGKHGSHPKLSSGLRKLNVAEEGHFISSLGTEMVSIANSCWEMVRGLLKIPKHEGTNWPLYLTPFLFSDFFSSQIWRDNSHSGFLICGLDVAEEYRRNEAKLPKGQTYISFTCWTRETLREVQKSKQRILDRAEKYQKQKQEALARMEGKGNFFKPSAVHRYSVFLDIIPSY